MPDPVTLGSNVLFFPKAELTRGKGLKLSTQRGVAVCTKRLLVMIPSRDVQIGAIKGKIMTRNEGDDGSLPQQVERLVQRTDLTVEALEAELTSLLGSDYADQAFEIAKLASFKVWSFGPLSQVRMKLAGGVTPIVFVPRGKGAVKQVKAFYA
ncbi:MAG: hypothetical protein R3B06_06755 [Kofleriaceae bacterium]